MIGHEKIHNVILRYSNREVTLEETLNVIRQEVEAAEDLITEYLRVRARHGKPPLTRKEAKRRIVEILREAF